MRRKYQVFISSSFEDLKDARQVLIQATLRKDHIPFGMEMLKAGTERGIDVIEKNIKKSDIFVIMIGARFGSPIDDWISDALTFTEKEYEFAIKYKLPIIAFLLDEAEYIKVRAILPMNSRERGCEGDLLKFRERVKRVEGGTRIVEFFSNDNLGDLAHKYSTSLSDEVEKLNDAGYQGGWIEGREYEALKDKDNLGLLSSENPFFQKLLEGLNRFKTLSKRTKIAEPLKKGIAWYFWQRYLPKLYEKKIKAIYFESGSSIAYVSHEFIEQVKDQSWFYQKNMHKQIAVRTNNLLTYLDFLIRDISWQPMDVRVMPYGPFSDDYGGTYGILNSAYRQPAPNKNDPVRTKLIDETQVIVNRVTKEFNKELTDRGLVLMTASGLDTRPESKDAPYSGPHVGSYPNMLLKRCLLSLPCPKVIFLHPDKWGFDFLWSNCHAVCDSGFPWKEVSSKSPLAIALAAETQTKQSDLAEELKKHGFTHLDLEAAKAGYDGPWSIIAANKPFEDFFKDTNK
jgi:hypothetical protein